ncbi:MAG: hypothetical protein LCH67_09785 [Bacteroidetes bacterium]|nr:hypothetical protein [Bacteroidota bacterium]
MKIKLLLVLLFLSLKTLAQQAFEVDSKGILIPRYVNLSAITTAITSPLQGMLVFNLATNSNWQYNGSSWQNTSGTIALPINQTINTTQPTRVLELTQASTGGTGLFRINNINNAENAIAGLSNGTGISVYGYNNGNGVAADFAIDNNLNSKNALTGFTNGLGSSADFIISNPVNNSPALVAKTNGTSNAGSFQQLNNNAYSPALLASHNGFGYAVLGRSYFGGAALFDITNIYNFYPSLQATTQGSGSAASFGILNTSNVKPTLVASTNGKGSVAVFSNTNNQSDSTTLKVNNIGRGSAISAFSYGVESPTIYSLKSRNLGSAGKFIIDHEISNSDAVYIESNGSGNVIHGVATKNGVAGFFENQDPESTKSQLVAYNVGLGHAFLSQAAGASGSAGRFENNSFNNAHLIYGDNYGTASGLYLKNHLVSGLNPIISAFQNGQGIGVDISINNNQNQKSVIKATTIGLGEIADFEINNALSSANGISVKTNGSGAALYAKNTGSASAAFFENTNTLTSANLIRLNSNGIGSLIFGTNTGSGSAADFQITNSTNPSNVINSFTNGNGHGLFVQKSGTSGSGGRFEISGSSSHTGNAIYASTSGVGSAIYALSSGTLNNAIEGIKSGTSGRAGFFEITNTSNNSNALTVNTLGGGSTLYLAHQGSGSSGNILIMNNNGFNVARVDRTGKGFFNGGTQNSGADLAEAFEVEGLRNSYEEGDILVISTSSDRKVEKSFEPYSNLVAGVYATKPGVLLTEENIDTPLDNQVPMGVVGVIPTKVCSEGGTIRRGDFIVSSSRNGYAMKGDPDKVKPGQIIGKALENFEAETGKIKVLVNIH